MTALDHALRRSEKILASKGASKHACRFTNSVINELRHLAGKNAGARAADTGACGFGKQDGVDRLGVDEKRRSLPGFGHGSVKSVSGREVVGAEEG